MNTQLNPAEIETSEGASAACRGRRLPTPFEMRHDVDVDEALQALVEAQRDAVRAILAGRDDRLLVIVGPCSIHDRQSALDYARRLAALKPELEDRMLLVMRVYVEKPRTTVGWKGLAYDPHLDGSHDMAEGLRQTRQLMREIAGLGVPVACELLQPMLAAYVQDLIAWAAVGARTTESQVHREMVSALPVPAGFKNGTGGDIGVAIDAMSASRQGHCYPGLDDHGRPTLIDSDGNRHTHLVLRGGHGRPNFDADSIERARSALSRAGASQSIMVDCSHANSGKDPARQSAVLEEVIRQRRAGQEALIGVMLESHLEPGNQPLCADLRYGVSITDACLGWQESAALLRLAAARLRG